MAKKKTPEKYLPWIEARRRSHLSDAHIQMARELGLNPKNSGGLADKKEAPSKGLLPEVSEKLNFQHFEKNRSDSVRAIEQMVRDSNRNKAEG